MDLSQIGPHTQAAAVVLPLLVQFGKTQLGLKGYPVALLSLALGSALGSLSLQGEAQQVFSAPGVPPALLGALWGVIVAAVLSGAKDAASRTADRLRTKREADAATGIQGAASAVPAAAEGFTTGVSRGRRTITCESLDAAKSTTVDVSGTINAAAPSDEVPATRADLEALASAPGAQP